MLIVMIICCCLDLGKFCAELMLLGFISLLITFGQQHIAKICISTKAGDTMLPCQKGADIAKGKGGNSGDESDDRRKLLWYVGDAAARRVLAAGGGSDHCSKHVS